MLKLGKKCKFKDIETGEVFAYEGCWEIWYKNSKNSAIKLADYISKVTYFLPSDIDNDWYDDDIVYKLSKSVQNLWRNY